MFFLFDSILGVVHDPKVIFLSFSRTSHHTTPHHTTPHHIITSHHTTPHHTTSHHTMITHTKMYRSKPASSKVFALLPVMVQPGPMEVRAAWCMRTVAIGC